MAFRLVLGVLLVALTGTLFAADPDPGAADGDATARYLAEQTLLLQLQRAKETRHATILALEAFRRTTEPPRTPAQASMLVLADQLERVRRDRVKTENLQVDLLRSSSLASPSQLSVAEAQQRASIDRVFRSLAQTGSSCCLCSSSAFCDDGVFCNGAESCDLNNTCARGSLPCLDGDSCTSDVCLEGSQSCMFDPLPPPDDVASLAVERDGVTAVGATLNWSPVADADAYNVYRGEMTHLGDMSCFAPLVPVTTVDDGSTPAGLFLYLVSSVGCGESGVGDDSWGARPLPPACP